MSKRCVTNLAFVFILIHIYVYFYTFFYYLSHFFETVSPRVKVYPLDHVASLGSNATFTCHATGIPTPAITWTKKGASLPTKHIVKNGSLAMFGLSVDDQGNYVCSASNAAGHGDVGVVLRIEGEYNHYITITDHY